MVETVTPLSEETTAIYAALEAGNKSWILAVGDADGLLAKIEQARCRASASGTGARALPACEAGYEGFWLARRLEGEDLEVVVCDPASLEVARRKKKAKTDRIDARKMVRARKGAAVAASGAALDALRAGKAQDPGGIASDDPAAAVPKHAHCAAALVALRGIGDNDALLPGGELFYRDFRNRRELASMAGLVPAPWASGGIDRDQGTGKAGNSMLRKHLIQMAWRWLFHQPGSALSRRYGNCVSARDGRSRKRAIVALARKLLVAPWRCATTGLVPEGAVFSKA